MSPRSIAPGSTVADSLQVPNLQRGLAILELLAQRPAGATLSELAVLLDLPPASVFRINKVLVRLGYLERDPRSKRFTLTRKFLAIGQPRSRDHSLSECAIDAMRGLRNATGETTQLCCIVGTEMVILDQLLATHPFKYSADLGARCPVYSCAPGKAILAWLPDNERDALLAALRYRRFTETTITTRAEMLAEMERIRACGYAVDRGEGMLGIQCVAAPIRDVHGYPIAAITIAGPAARVAAERFAQIGTLVIDAAEAAATRFRG